MVNDDWKGSQRESSMFCVTVPLHHRILLSSCVSLDLWISLSTQHVDLGTLTSVAPGGLTFLSSLVAEIRSLFSPLPGSVIISDKSVTIIRQAPDTRPGSCARWPSEPSGCSPILAEKPSSWSSAHERRWSLSTSGDSSPGRFDPFRCRDS